MLGLTQLCDALIVILMLIVGWLVMYVENLRRKK